MVRPNGAKTRCPNSGSKMKALALFALLGVVLGTNAAVLHVPSEFPTIQAAIGSATPGDVVRIAAGTYSENLTVDRAISLYGAGGSTVIRPALGNGILIAASGSSSNAPLTIGDLTVAQCPGNGIRIASAVNHLRLANVMVSNCASYGFEIHNVAIVTNLFATNCAFVGMTNSIGMRVRGSIVGLSLVDCLFEGNLYGFQSVKGNGDGTALTDVLLDHCSFVDNALKGAYFEKLNDAVFDQLSMSANGSESPYPAGVDINLKYGAYGNITFIAPTILDCGLGDPSSGVGITIKARNDGAYALSPASLTGVTISDGIVARCPAGISIGNNVLDATIQNMALAGNFTVGLLNWTDAATITATNNWWGDESGPSLPSAGPPSSTFLGYGDRAYWMTNNVTTLSPSLGKPVQSNALDLVPTDASVFIRPGQGIIVDMNVANLATNVNACQAFLGYSSTFFADPNGGAVQPGGGVWDDLIYDVWRDTTNGVPGEIDTAIGIDVTNSFVGLGTMEDGTVAKIALTSRSDVEGVTHMVFRPDADPDSGQIESTFFSNVGGDYPIWAAKIDSATIYIDGTPPTMAIAAVQDQPPDGFVDVKDGINAVLSGTVLIAIAASDALSGLDAPPLLTLTNGLQTAMVTYLGESPYGVFNYSWEVSSATTPGTWSATALSTDRAGNQTTSLFELYVQSFSIAGQVELQSFVGTGTAHSRTVTFVATGGASTKTWTQSLTNASGAIFSFTLNDVPPGTTHVSAKTNWNLRKKLAVVFDEWGQASATFTGTQKLLADDINADNQVQVIDYVILRNNYFTTQPTPDLNGDGLIQAFDYALLRGNWFSAGDPE